MRVVETFTLRSSPRPKTRVVPHAIASGRDRAEFDCPFLAKRMLSFRSPEDLYSCICHSSAARSTVAWAVAWSTQTSLLRSHLLYVVLLRSEKINLTANELGLVGQVLAVLVGGKLLQDALTACRWRFRAALSQYSPGGHLCWSHQAFVGRNSGAFRLSCTFEVCFLSQKFLLPKGAMVRDAWLGWSERFPE